MTGYHGTYVISWHQTEIDGQTGAPVQALGTGSNWRWRGAAIRVDGAPDILVLDHADESDRLRRHAADRMQRMLGAAAGRRPARGMDDDGPLFNAGFELTDGRRTYSATIVAARTGPVPLVIFVGPLPPEDSDLWVVRADLQPTHGSRVSDQPAGMICFTPGTRIRLADDDRPVETLRAGDRVQTKDNGLQEVLWIGQRRISGARLHAMPELRPVRLRAGVLGLDIPDRDLLVSPQHRVNLRAPGVQALFNTGEVLVEVQDLIDGRLVHTDHSVRDVTYFHLLLNRHEIVWANGVETESFHPAAAALHSVPQEQRAVLFDRFPGLEQDVTTYGDYARRTLSRFETAILRRDAA